MITSLLLALTKASIFLVNNALLSFSLTHFSFPSCHLTIKDSYERKFPPAVTEITHSDEKNNLGAIALDDGEITATLL